MPESGSETDQLTLTLTLFQPFVFGPGVTVGTITGAVVSTPKVAVCVNAEVIVSGARGLLVELSSHWMKKYPVPGPPLTVRSIPTVPVDVPEFNQIVNGAASEAVPDDELARNTAVGCDEGRPFVWIVRRYWSCQFQVKLEAAFIVKVTVLVEPVAGTLPVPVQPFATYCIPVPAETGDVTDSVIEAVALNHPLDGVGLPCEEITVRKYW
jgi:hypothetical protein